MRLIYRTAHSVHPFMNTGKQSQEGGSLTFNSYCRQCHVTNGRSQTWLEPVRHSGEEVGSQRANYSSAIASSDLVWDERH